MSWSKHADDALLLLLENMVAEGMLAKQIGLDVTPASVIGSSKAAILEVIRSSLPLAKIMDSSDLVLHAEGPALRHESLKLSAVNWITCTAESTVRKLSGSLFHLSSKDARRMSRALDLRLTGLAPGSLYAGIAVEEGEPGLLAAEDEPVVSAIRTAVRQLPEIPKYLGAESVRLDVREAIPDPAQRDATFAALLELAPTGRRGIHTMEIASPGRKSASLSQRERVVLKDAVDRPKLKDRKHGAFVGQLREIDLDSHRFHLREVEGIGGIRCVVNSLDRSKAKHVLGEFVRVTGDFESDEQGRPRLMIVTDIDVLPSAQQPQLLP